MRKNMILFYFVISNFTPYQQTIESDYNKNFSIKLFSYSDIKKVNFKNPPFILTFICLMIWLPNIVYFICSSNKL